MEDTKKVEQAEVQKGNAGEAKRKKEIEVDQAEENAKRVAKELEKKEARATAVWVLVAVVE